MYKKGQVVFFGFMLGLVIILLALALAPPIKQSIDNARSSMDCNNQSISNFQKAGCLATDSTMFYFTIGILMIGGIVIGARIYS